MAIDYDTDLGRVRLLTSDVNESSPLLTDEQITALLSMEGSVKRAAAQALDTIASSEVLVSKVIRTLDLQTDGAKVSAELRARANDLRQQDEDDNDDPWAIDIVNFDPIAAYRIEGI